MDCGRYFEAGLLAYKIIFIHSYIYIILTISTIYIYNLTYFIILLHYYITNIYMCVFLIVCVYIYMGFKGCHVIVGPMGN